MRVTTNAFEFIRTLVMRDTGIVIDRGKEYLVDSRLEPIVVREGMASLDELVAQLRGDENSPLRLEINEAMATHETWFFRDGRPFKTLDEEVLPALMEARQSSRTLRLWSAASSSGQEAYSIAIVLLEHCPSLAGWQLDVHASDFSPVVLERARAGLFTDLEVSRGLPVRYLEKYFTPDRGGYRASSRLRGMLHFNEVNLARAWPPMPQMDVIFLRNVLVYFDQPTRTRVLDQVRAAMRPGGYLFLGGAESTMTLDPVFERVDRDRSVCRFHPRDPDDRPSLPGP